MMTDLPVFVRGILTRLENCGYKAYLVGGCLRDMLLGRNIHDWDVATSARSAEVLMLFPKTVETGVRFGTVTVLTSGGPVEVTTLRSDGVYSDSRRPDDVRFVDDLEEDLKRRDFTINAMAMTLEGVLSDPFGGRDDLKRRLIRCVGRSVDRFSEDALRMFRALRFSAQLGFDIESETMAGIRACANQCAALSAERVRDETEKILMSDRPELALTAVALGLFAGRIGKQEDDRLSAGDRTGLVPDTCFIPGDTAAQTEKGGPWDVRMRWAAFTAVLLDRRMIDDADGFLTELRLDAVTVRQCGAGVNAALQGPLPKDTVGLKRLLSAIGSDAARCAAAADEALHGGDAVLRLESVLAGGECYSLGTLAVKGGDLIALGIAPGKELGIILKQLLSHVLEHPEDNNLDILLKFAENSLKSTLY